MTKSVTTQQPRAAGPPAPLNAMLARALDVAHNGLDLDGTIASTHAPTEAQMRALTARKGELSHALTPADRREAGRLVALMLVGWRNGNVPADEAEAVVAVYVKALDDIPLWAVSRACDAAIKGDAGVANLAFAPKPPEMRRACKALIDHAERELARINVVLVAPRAEFKPDPKIGERLKKLAQDLGDSLAAPEKPSAFMEAISKGDDAGARTIAAGMIEGLRLSDAAMRRFAPRAEHE